MKAAKTRMRSRFGYGKILPSVGALAALAASIFHYGTYTVGDLKTFLAQHGVEALAVLIGDAPGALDRLRVAMAVADQECDQGVALLLARIDGWLCCVVQHGHAPHPCTREHTASGGCPQRGLLSASGCDRSASVKRMTMEVALTCFSVLNNLIACLIADLARSWTLNVANAVHRPRQGAGRRAGLVAALPPR